MMAVFISTILIFAPVLACAAPLKAGSIAAQGMIMEPPKRPCLYQEYIGHKAVIYLKSGKVRKGKIIGCKNENEIMIRSGFLRHTYSSAEIDSLNVHR